MAFCATSATTEAMSWETAPMTFHQLFTREIADAMRRTRTKRTTKTIGKLRIEHRRQALIRMMFQGWSTKKCARALHCTDQTVRQMTATPEYQSAYTLYEREMFTRLDRQMPRLLLDTIKALAKLLRHKDWRA